MRSSRRCVVHVQFDIIVVHTIGGKQADDTVGLERLIGEHALQQCLRIVVQLGGFSTDLFVLQDRREAAMQFPGDKERRPVDVTRDFLERIVAQRTDAELAGCRRGVRGPIDFRLVGARLGE